MLVLFDLLQKMPLVVLDPKTFKGNLKMNEVNKQVDKTSFPGVTIGKTGKARQLGVTVVPNLLWARITSPCG